MPALRTSVWILTLLFAFLPIAQAKVIYAYVGNNPANSGTVSVINTSTNKVVKTIPVDIRIVCLAINRAASFVYVASYNPNTAKYKISVISTSSNSVVATIPSLLATHIAFALNGKTAYIATGGYDVEVLNTVTGKYMAPIKLQGGTSGLAVTPNGKFLYVVNGLGVSVISLATNKVVTNITLLNLQGSYPTEIAISPDGSTAYVTFYNWVHVNWPSGVQVIATSSNTVVNTINVPAEPASARVSPDGRWLYVPQYGLTSVAVIDTSTQTVTNNIPVSGFSPADVAFTPNGAFAYVLDTGGVSVINTAKQTETGLIFVAYPKGIAVMGTW
jgi:YVTN family beta-propeller protein